MTMYRYVKAAPPKRRTPKPIAVSYAFISVGTIVILWTVWPILSFFLTEQPVLATTVSPLVEERSGALQGSASIDGMVGRDITNANTWFPTQPQKKVSAPVNSYMLSIPSLSITDASVIIAGDDLAQSLIHYGGTGLPGEYGTTVVFGHSTLPQFFRGIKDYKTIFATLPTIKEGADIYVTYDSVSYRYQVVDKVVVEPNDLTALEQHFDDSYLTLVTCVPPGTYLYRLNVKAKLVRI